MNLKLWQRRLFYLILFLIPANLAKHFILPSSYVSGILVDYLIPTLYLTDILIIALLGSELRFGKGPLGYEPPVKIRNLLVFLVALLPSVIFATSPVPAIYKYLKFLLFILFAFWIKQNIDFKKHFNTIINVLSASVLFQSLLALAQWLKQSSVFGYWFLGEQPFTSATPGIDKITWFTGAVKIPPMGTFPHPNVLAGFLAVTLPLILYKLQCKGSEPLHGKTRLGSELQSRRKSKGSELPVQVRNLPRFITILLGLTTLFLTFSLSAWLAFLMIGLPLTLLATTKIRPLKFILIYSGLFLILFSFATKFQFLAPTSSFTRRSQLSKIALKTFKHFPLTGVGLNNFTVNMEHYGYITATTRFLQPVHNIYLLILAETGLVALIGFLYLLYKGSEPLYVNISKPITISLLTLLFIGLFDHYPLTIQQGLLLFFFLI